MNECQVVNRECADRLARIETKLDDILPLVKSHERQITWLKGVMAAIGAFYTAAIAWFSVKH